MRRSPWAGAAVFAFFATWALIMIVPAVFRSSGRSGNEAQQLASRELAEHIREVPFLVRLPETLPGGARVVRAVLDKPDYDRGAQVYTLNVYYSVPGQGDVAGHSVHVWQTNDPFLARNPGGDPTTRGVPETIDGRQWTRVVDDRLRDHAPVTAFSTRFDDDVTVAVDATDADDARAAVRALAEVTPGELTGGVDEEIYLAEARKGAR